MSDMILTPIMISNTEPSGEVSASSTYQTRYPWHAFTQNENGDIYYNWASNGTSGGEWIQYQFTKAQKVTKIDFYNRNASDGYYPTQLTVKGSNDGTNWTELGVYTSFNSGAKTKTTLVIVHPSNYKIYRLIFDSMTPSANGYAGASRIDLIGDQPHLKSSGSTEAIRDWLNASLYNKEEIDDLFIQNNQAGLIPYDLMITGDQPEQTIKLVGQTSGKTYNICLAAILGESDKYCYHGLLWFGQGEDVKIFDSDSGEELLEHTLSKRMDEIELPQHELPYDTSSPYYFEETGQFTTFGGRSYQKTNAGPAYCLCQYNGTESTPVLLSKDQNCVKENYPSYEHSFEYLGETWWTGGNQYGFSSNYSSAPRYMDISSYGPFSTSSTDNYRLPIIQKAIASLNIIYNKNVPIPQLL